MTIRRHSNFEARQLVLFGAAAIVLLVFAWTFANWRALPSLEPFLQAKQ